MRTHMVDAKANPEDEPAYIEEEAIVQYLLQPDVGADGPVWKCTIACESAFGAVCRVEAGYVLARFLRRGSSAAVPA